MVSGIRGAEVSISRLLFFCAPFVWSVYFVVEPNRSGLAATVVLKPLQEGESGDRSPHPKSLLLV